MITPLPPGPENWTFMINVLGAEKSLLLYANNDEF
jgi:hypothetical protein